MPVVKQFKKHVIREELRDALVGRKILPQDLGVPKSCEHVVQASEAIRLKELEVELQLFLEPFGSANELFESGNSNKSFAGGFHSDSLGPSELKVDKEVVEDRDCVMLLL